MLACGGSGGATSDSDSDSNTGTTGDPAGEALEFSDFFLAAEQTYCDWAVRCGGFASAEACDAAEFFEVMYPRNLLASGYFDGGESGVAVEYLLASHAAGRIVFDAEAAAVCLAYVEARGCLEPGTYAPSEAEIAGQAACEAVMHGAMVANGPCLLSLECAAEDDARVVCGFAPTCSDACCVGGCRTLTTAPIGTPCTNQTRCAEGSYCARDPDLGTFTTCSALRPIGAACQDGNECAADSFCDFNAGKCAGLVGEGESCVAFGSASCMPGLYCADPGFVDEGRCYAYAPLGGSCLNDWYDGCNELGAICDQEATLCVAGPTAGQPCQDGSCAPSASCDWNTDLCVAAAGEGEPCGQGVECAGALRCDGWDLAIARCQRPEITSVCPVPDENQLPEGT